MDKLVYLFELDSVRKTKNEIELGQDALYDEIVMHGNTVVCTFNQITDSPSFLAILSDNKKYNDFLKLINLGKIRISRYADMRTPSQYVQQNLEKNIKIEDKNSFIFSALPITYDDIDKQKDILLALRNSDLSRFYEKINDPKTTDKEVKELTILSRFVELVIIFSMQKLTINEAKKDKSLCMSEFIFKIINIRKSVNKSFLQNNQMIIFNEACNILESFYHDFKELVNNRSVWINKLHKYNEKQLNNNQYNEMKMAEAIIDLCYNYTLEDSILNISKHYKNFDINSEDSFYNDFFNRLQFYITSNHEFLKPDSKESTFNNVANLPDWEIAVSIIEQTKINEKNNILNLKKLVMYVLNLIKSKDHQIENLRYYEENFKIELIAWNILIVMNLITRTIFVIFGICMFFIFTNFSNLLQEKTIELLVDIPDYMKEIFNILIFGIIITSLSKKLKIPDPFESFKKILSTIKIMSTILKNSINDAYYNLKIKEK